MFRRVIPSLSRDRHDRGYPSTTSGRQLDFFDLVELEFAGGFAAENRDERADLFFFRLDVVDDPGEVEERARGDLDAVALGEIDLELGRLDAHLLEDRLHFFVLQRNGFLT